MSRLRRAARDFGRQGYSGSIAEKRDFILFEAETGITADEQARGLINTDDLYNSDDPAGCIQIGAEQFLFFGWARS